MEGVSAVDGRWMGVAMPGMCPGVLGPRQEFGCVVRAQVFSLQVSLASKGSACGFGGPPAPAAACTWLSVGSATRPERAGGVLPRPRADRAGAAVISQAGSPPAATLPPVVPAPGQKHAATASMAALRAAARDQHSIGHIDPATTRTQIRRLRGRTGLTVFRSSHCSRDLLRQFLRSSQTTPATAPRIITAPIAMNQVMMPKIAPTVPYVLLSEMIVPEK